MTYPDRVDVLGTFFGWFFGSFSAPLLIETGGPSVHAKVHVKACNLRGFLDAFKAIAGVSATALAETPRH
jgi:hypothetical protein